MIGRIYNILENAGVRASRSDLEKRPLPRRSSEIVAIISENMTSIGRMA
jgi:hypothetical protein